MRLTVRWLAIALGCAFHVILAAACGARLLDAGNVVAPATYELSWSRIAFDIVGLLSPVALILAAWPTALGRILYGSLVAFLWGHVAFWAWFAPYPQLLMSWDFLAISFSIAMLGVPIICLWSTRDHRSGSRLLGACQPQTHTQSRGRSLGGWLWLAAAATLMIGVHWLTMDEFQYGIHYLRKGERAFHRSEWNAAERAFTKAILRFPEDEYPLNFRGRVRIEMGDMEGALDDFRKATKHDSTGEAQLLIGITLCLAGEWHGARESFENAIRLGSESAHGQDALQRLGALNSQMRVRNEPVGPRYGPRVRTAPSSPAAPVPSEVPTPPTTSPPPKHRLP